MASFQRLGECQNEAEHTCLWNATIEALHPIRIQLSTNSPSRITPAWRCSKLGSSLEIKRAAEDPVRKERRVQSADGEG